MLPVARAASCTCCQLHVLPLTCVARCTCCQLHMLLVANLSDLNKNLANQNIWEISQLQKTDYIICQIGKSLQCPRWPRPRKSNTLPMNQRNDRTRIPSHSEGEGLPYSQGRNLFTSIVEIGGSPPPTTTHHHHPPPPTTHQHPPSTLCLDTRVPMCKGAKLTAKK